MITESKGVLAGKQLQPREIAGLAYSHGWRDWNLMVSVCVVYSESDGWTRAHNDNIDDETGEVTSRDVGLWQINIGAEWIGTSTEETLYDPVENTARARELFIRRGFQPWVGYTSGAWLNDYRTYRALLGCMNFFAQQLSALGADVHVPVVSLPQLRSLYPGKNVG